MADNSPIEWTDATWNVIVGCSVVSPGCTNCYAMRQAPRTDELSIGAPWGGPTGKLTQPSKAGPVWTGAVRFVDRRLDQPLRWRRPRKIFVNSMGDLFHEDVPDEWIDRVFAVMALAPQHVFMVLTKRTKRTRDYLGTLAGDWMVRLPDATPDVVSEAAHESLRVTWPLPNVWIGCSVEDQARADERIPELLDTPAAVRFISAEPLLGPVHLGPGLRRYVDDEAFIARGERNRAALDAICNSRDLRPKLDWVIAGGESGTGARPMHPDWARSLRDQCAAAGVPFFFKQWGEWAEVEPALDYFNGPRMVREGDCFIAPDGRSETLTATLGTALEDCGLPLRRVGKKAAGRLLDGREHSEFPSLRQRDRADG